MYSDTITHMTRPARLWNAGFIRQVSELCAELPDESGVPAVASGYALNRKSMNKTLFHG